jgi:hypothetical protein
VGLLNPPIRKEHIMARAKKHVEIVDQFVHLDVDSDSMRLRIYKDKDSMSMWGVMAAESQETGETVYVVIPASDLWRLHEFLGNMVVDERQSIFDEARAALGMAS